MGNAGVIFAWSAGSDQPAARVHYRSTDSMAGTLTLVRAARKSDGEWSSDDYDVFQGSRQVGHIALTAQAPEGKPWFWTITVRPDSPQNRGYAVSREQAMRELNARWLNPATF